METSDVQGYQHFVNQLLAEGIIKPHIAKRYINEYQGQFDAAQNRGYNSTADYLEIKFLQQVIDNPRDYSQKQLHQAQTRILEIEGTKKAARKIKLNTPL